METFKIVTLVALSGRWKIRGGERDELQIASRHVMSFYFLLKRYMSFYNFKYPVKSLYVLSHRSMSFYIVNIFL